MYSTYLAEKTQDNRTFPNTNSIPEELRNLKQWVTWRLEPRDGRNTKVPYAASGRHASIANRAGWTTFERAWNAFERNPTLAGVGFVFTADDPYVGIDLDHAIIDGFLEPWATEIIDRIDSYAELSPSGSGIHIICKGELPPNGRRRGSVEMYDRHRYFTMTGERLIRSLRTIEQRDTELAAVHAEHIANPVVNPRVNPEAPGATDSQTAGTDDAELLRRMFNARNGTEVAALWNGDIRKYDGDASRADLALCQYFAFWTARNASQIDRLFRESALMRPKWDERHGAATYGGMTIALAIRSSSSVYVPRGRAE